jgi:hypothetical protein
VHNVADHQIRNNDVDALKSMPCDHLGAASSCELVVSPPFREVTIWASKKCHSVGSRIAAFLWVGVDICLSRGRRVKLPDRATRRPGVDLSDLEYMVLLATSPRRLS